MREETITISRERWIIAQVKEKNDKEDFPFRIYRSNFMYISIEKISLFFRFCIVGIGNTLIDFSFFFLLIKIGAPYLSAQLIAYSAGILNSFIWNRYWTFQQKQKMRLGEIIRFLLINMIALMATNILLIYLYDFFETSLFLSKVIATVVGVCITFLGSRYYVFQHKKAEI